jgi:hypothetical protein
MVQNLSKKHKFTKVRVLDLVPVRNARKRHPPFFMTLSISVRPTRYRVQKKKKFLKMVAYKIRGIPVILLGIMSAFAGKGRHPT